MTGYDIISLEIVVADMTYASLAEHELVPARAEESTRMLTAQGGGFTFEFEISGEVPRLAGRVIPMTAGTITFDQMGNTQAVLLDDAAVHEFGLAVGQPFRLRLTREDGEPVATASLTHSG